MSASSLLPVPPAEGWTLMRAAELLCPEDYRCFVAGRSGQEKLARRSLGDWYALLPEDTGGDAELELAAALLAAVVGRPDLTLSGLDVSSARGALDAPVPLRRDVLSLAIARDTSRPLDLRLHLAEGRAELVYSFPAMRADLPHDVTLHAVRVVRVLPPPTDEPRKRAKPGPARGTPQKGGRAVDRAVAAAIADLGAKLISEGAPEAGRGGQAELEDWLTEQIERRGGKLSEGRVRVHVRRALKRHRQAIG